MVCRHKNGGHAVVGLLEPDCLARHEELMGSTGPFQLVPLGRLSTTSVLLALGGPRTTTLVKCEPGKGSLAGQPAAEARLELR